MPLSAECLPVRTGAPLLAPLLTHSGLEKKHFWAAVTESSTHLAHISMHPPAGARGSLAWPQASVLPHALRLSPPPTDSCPLRLLTFVESKPAVQVEVRVYLCNRDNYKYGDY